MPEEEEGYYDKYNVTKKNGETDPHADYFVLRLDTDPHARVAAKAYAESVNAENTMLALDVYSRVSKHEPIFPKKDEPRTDSVN